MANGPLEETSDRLARWNGRWVEHKLGWHRADVHPCLSKYFSHVTDNCPSEQDKERRAEGLRWLVTLCGKTVDMAYLATREMTAHVVGVDGIRIALDEFAAEHKDLQIGPKTDQVTSANENYEVLAGNKISLLKGDFFALDESATGGSFDVIWDRASMVAIQPALREEYVQTSSGNIKKPGCKNLSASIEKRTGTEEGISKGPPFSIPESEVRRLYEGQDWVESVTLLEEIDEFSDANDPEKSKRFISEGVTSMYELCFLILAK